MLTATATRTAEAEDAMVPAKYSAEILDFGTATRDDLRAESVSMGRRRARAPSLWGRALARIVRPKLMLLNLIPAMFPAA